MSLTSQFNEIMSKMDTAYDKTEQVHGGTDSSSSSNNTSEADMLEAMMDPTTKNKWICTAMPWAGSRVSPTTTHLTNYLKTNRQFRNQDTSQNWAWGDYYIGTRECWLYFTSSYSTTITWWTDDEGTLFLNDSQIGTSGSCANTNNTLNFRKGLNHLVISFSEKDGGDAGYMTTNPFTMPYVKWGYGCFKV